MVMERPSAELVGSEFVRQYYTLMHDSPQFLHRFYSVGSCFKHSGNAGESVGVVHGQEAIHEQIMSLNFRDAKAKIKHVDAQSSVGEAVVVQVTGELSNDNKPLRRFMQTFVLCPQSPLKFYVHNDIFCYQDEVFRETDSEEDQIESEESMEQDNPVPAAPEPYYDSAESVGSQPQQAPVAASPLVSMAQPLAIPAVPQQPEVATPDSASLAQPSYTLPTAAALNTTATLNNGVSTVEAIESEAAPSAEEEELDTPQQQEAQPSTFQAADPEPMLEPTKQPQAPPAISTWSSVVGKAGNSAKPAAAVAAPPVVQPTRPAPEQQRAPAAPASAEVAPPKAPQAGGFGNNMREQPRGGPFRGRMGPGQEDRERKPIYPDSHQVFIGNMSMDVQETEIKDFLAEYGTVVDIRVNRPFNKSPFGFVTFDNDAAVKKILARLADTPQGRMQMNGRTVNIQEKKPKEFPGRSDSRPSSATRSGPRGGMGGPRPPRTFRGGNTGGGYSRDGNPGRFENGGNSEGSSFNRGNSRR